MRNDLATDDMAVTGEMAVFGTHPHKRSRRLGRGRSYRCQVLRRVIPIGPAPQMMVVVVRGGLGCAVVRSARRVL
jgi:hypothetical protein